MSAKLEKIENSEAYLQIEVDAEAFEEGLQKAYRKVVKQVSYSWFPERESASRASGSAFWQRDSL